MYCHTEIICGQRKVSGYMFTCYQMLCCYFLGIQKKTVMVCFRIQSKDQEKTIIHNAVGLDATIMKSIYIGM